MRLVGPGIWEPDTAVLSREKDERPLVLVTCSTEYQNDGAIIEATLPGLVVRAFVRRNGVGGITEVPLAIDTLFADLDASTISLTWRGVTDVADMDFDDVKTLLVASDAKGAKTSRRESGTQRGSHGEAASKKSDGTRTGARLRAPVLPDRRNDGLSISSGHCAGESSDW